MLFNANRGHILVIMPRIRCDDDVCLVIKQHTDLDIGSPNKLLTKQSAAFGNITTTLNQRILDLTLQCCVLKRKIIELFIYLTRIADSQWLRAVFLRNSKCHFNSIGFDHTGNRTHDLQYSLHAQLLHWCGLH